MRTAPPQSKKEINSQLRKRNQNLKVERTPYVCARTFRANERPARRWCLSLRVKGVFQQLRSCEKISHSSSTSSSLDCILNCAFSE